MSLTSWMNRRFVALSAVAGVGITILPFANSEEDWQSHTDQQLQITFRCPKKWKQGPTYTDRTYLEDQEHKRPAGHIQLLASDGDTTEVCRLSATHKLQPYGAHPKIRSMKIQGQKACLVWPSKEQGENADALLVIALPRPVKIDGVYYGQLMLEADQNHIRQIGQTIRFLSSAGQRDAR